MVDEFRPSASSFSSSRCESFEGILVRQATIEDEQEIVELSCCIYKEHDWLAPNFTKVLQKEKTHIFVAVVEGHIGGCVMCRVVDSDATLVMWGMRIHPQYRRRNISHHLRDAVFTFARNNYPSVLYERFTAISENKHVERLRVKLGFKKVKEYKGLSVAISDEVRKLLLKVLQAVMTKNCSMKKVFKEDILPMIGVHQLPTRTAIMEYVPYELTESNIDMIFEENDAILVDKDPTKPSRTDRLRNFFPGLKPSGISSFSHGRFVQRVENTRWEAVLYAFTPLSTRDHLQWQLREALQTSKDKFVFTCFHADYNAEVVWDVLLQELCLRQLEEKQPTKIIIYERPVNNNEEQAITSTL